MSLISLVRAQDHTHIHTLRPHASCPDIHYSWSQTLAHWWNSFYCYSLPLTILSFFSPSLMSSWCCLLLVHLFLCQVCGSNFNFPFFFSDRPLSFFLSYRHIFPIFQSLPLCFPRYVKPLHCQDIQHMRMNDLHVLSQWWYELGHIWLWCIYCTHIDKVPVNIINHSLVLALRTQPCGSDFCG